MPNGGTRNWMRLCLAIDGFRLRYKRWPTRILLDPVYIEELQRDLLSSQSFKKLTARITPVPRVQAHFIAQDEYGREFGYSTEEFPSEEGDKKAEEWLDITLDGPYTDDY